MTLVLILITVSAVVFGQAAWRSILKSGVYPSSISPLLKRFHALALSFLGLYVFFAFLNILRLIRYFSVILAYFNSHLHPIAGPLTGALYLVSCASGFFLPSICDEMAKRKRKALTKFFTVWPISFIATTYVMVPLIVQQSNAESALVVVGILFVLFLASILFYLNSGTRSSLFSRGDGSG